MPTKFRCVLVPKKLGKNSSINTLETQKWMIFFLEHEFDVSYAPSIVTGTLQIFSHLKIVI